MSYMGVGYSGYEYETCPLCGEGMWNGRCENPDCEYHWHPKEDDEGEGGFYHGKERTDIYI
jgi:hypothetical protein